MRLKKCIVPALITIIWMFITAISLNSCNGDFGLPPTSEQNLIATAGEIPELSTFLDVINQAGLADTLSNFGPYTIFAPTNDAFDTINLNGIPTVALNQIMRYHILPQRRLTQFFSKDSIRTLQGNTFLQFQVEEGRITINRNSIILNGDIEAINGMIHIIDRILIPD